MRDVISPSVHVVAPQRATVCVCRATPVRISHTCSTNSPETGPAASTVTEPSKRRTIKVLELSSSRQFEGFHDSFWDFVQQQGLDVHWNACDAEATRRYLAGVHKATRVWWLQAWHPLMSILYTVCHTQNAYASVRSWALAREVRHQPGGQADPQLSSFMS